MDKNTVPIRKKKMVTAGNKSNPTIDDTDIEAMMLFSYLV